MVLSFTIMASTVTIDEAGRLVIPQAVRMRLSLHAGSRLRLTERDNQIVLEPEPTEVLLKEKSGVLVLVGELEGAVPDHRDLRGERIDAFIPAIARTKRK